MNKSFIILIISSLSLLGGVSKLTAQSNQAPDNPQLIYHGPDLPESTWCDPNGIAYDTVADFTILYRRDTGGFRTIGHDRIGETELLMDILLDYFSTILAVEAQQREYEDKLRASPPTPNPVKEEPQPKKVTFKTKQM